MENREGLSFPRDLDLFYHLIVFRGVVFFQSNYLVDVCCQLSDASRLPSKQNKKKEDKSPVIVFWWEIHANNLRLGNNFSEFTLFSWEMSHRSSVMEEMATVKMQMLWRRKGNTNTFPEVTSPGWGFLDAQTLANGMFS